MRLDLLLCVIGIHSWRMIYPWGENWGKKARMCRICHRIQVYEEGSWNTATASNGYVNLMEKQFLYDIYRAYFDKANS